MSVEVLGVRIDVVSRREAMERAVGFLQGEGIHTIFTPNPEMIIAAQKDGYFKRILNRGALNLCDGQGIALIFKWKKNQPLERITGVDFMKDICAYAEKYGFSVYLLGAGIDETIKQAAEKLKTEFPSLRIAGFHPGPRLENPVNAKLKYLSNDNEAVIGDIVLTQPDILFVGFGHGKQEKYIAENMDKLRGVKISMGVGGAFDIISGRLKRAPKFLRILSLEWFWRLIQEPRRWKRVWTAVVIFPLKFIFQK